MKGIFSLGFIAIVSSAKLHGIVDPLYNIKMGTTATPSFGEKVLPVVQQPQPLLYAMPPQQQFLSMQPQPINYGQYMPSYGMPIMPTMPVIDYAQSYNLKMGPDQLINNQVATNSQMINVSSSASGHSNANTNSDNSAISTNYNTIKA